MSNVSRDIFQKNWDSFITRLKGRMIKQSESKMMSYSLAKLLLSDAVTDWDSEYEESGRWLRALCNENSDKGELIREVLLEMSFTETAPNKSYSTILNFAVPIVGALTGYGLSSFYHAGTLVKAVSTVAPAAVLYPSVKTLGDMAKENAKTALIEEYISQLDKYRDSVLSILTN